jgi:hypothetical protein
MNHRVDAGKRIRHVARRREVADDGPARLRRQHGRPAQKDAHAIATLRQLTQQVASDESGCARECDERGAHAVTRMAGALKRQSTKPTSVAPRSSAAI